MSEKKEPAGKATDEMPDNDCLKKDAGLTGRGHIPVCNMQSFGIASGRSAALRISARVGDVIDYTISSYVGGGKPWEQGDGEVATRLPPEGGV
jgi:hypothetical protein